LQSERYHLSLLQPEGITIDFSNPKASCFKKQKNMSRRSSNASVTQTKRKSPPLTPTGRSSPLLTPTEVNLHPLPLAPPSYIPNRCEICQQQSPFFENATKLGGNNTTRHLR
ncbi:MAG: hypothetical protein ACKO96_40335, partial [Flammeovirgaceae bacterium]